MAFWKTSSFKLLQLSWYQRLEKEGFQDAEKMVNDELVLKQNAEYVYRKVDSLGVASKEAYYFLLGKCVHNSEFESEADRLIMVMFAQGSALKLIGQALKKQGMPRCRLTIRVTIRKYEMIWGLREYTRKQLNKREIS